MAIGPQAFELFPFVLHHLNGLGADAAAGFGVIRFEIDDLQILPAFDHFLDHLDLVGIRKPFLRLFVLKTGQELDHLIVHENVMLSDGLAKDDALERGAAAQGHIDLTMGKGAPADVDDHLFKGLALTLVDGNGPGQLQGILGEGAHRLGKYFLGQGIVGVFKDLPGKGSDLDDKIILQAPPGWCLLLPAGG